jgi:hypothetical protein
MTMSIGSAAPDPISGGTRQEAREVRRRTVAGVITLAIGVAAAKGLASDRGTPALDWYRARGRDNSRS